MQEISNLCGRHFSIFLEGKKKKTIGYSKIVAEMIWVSGCCWTFPGIFKVKSGSLVYWTDVFCCFSITCPRKRDSASPAASLSSCGSCRSSKSKNISLWFNSTQKAAKSSDFWQFSLSLFLWFKRNESMKLYKVVVNQSSESKWVYWSKISNICSSHPLRCGSMLLFVPVWLKHLKTSFRESFLFRNWISSDRGGYVCVVCRFSEKSYNPVCSSQMTRRSEISLVGNVHTHLWPLTAAVPTKDSELLCAWQQCLQLCVPSSDWPAQYPNRPIGGPAVFTL